MAVAANFILSLLFTYCSLLCIAHSHCSSYDSIYQFGDSMSDTGNYILESLAGASSPYTRLPYGETYFNRPTGRASDGRLMIDFFAQELGLPLLKPYLNKSYSPFPHGANFAVGGATALDTTLLRGYNITGPTTNSSLLVQLNWFLNHLDSTCSRRAGCVEKIRKAQFMVGEIGGNDYSYAFLGGKSVDDVKSLLVPLVIQKIIYVVRKLIDRGATRLVVPGIFPIGCFPIILSVFQSNNSTSYDDTKCLKEYNEFTIYHNKHLQNAIRKLRKQRPGVVILYADHYNAFQWMLSSSGFEEDNTLKACCGAGGGDYNFDLTKLCGVGGVSSCPNPARHISWDGVHFTEGASYLIVNWLLKHHSLSLGKYYCVHSECLRSQ